MCVSINASSPMRASFTRRRARHDPSNSVYSSRMQGPVRRGVGAPCTVLSGATVIDGRGGPPAVGADVVITGERIAAVGPVGTTERPAGALVIDCRGKFVLPGLIDVHVHYFEWM